MNEARFTGNLTRDPETRKMTNGKTVTTFVLAVQRKYTNQNTGKRDADFIRFVAYDRTGDIAAKYLKKGRKILVNCHVRTGKYQSSKDANMVYTTDFIVDSLEFMTATNTTPQQQETAESYSQPPEAEAYDTDTFTEVEDDDLPF